MDRIRRAGAGKEPELEITPEMEEVGAARLRQLLDAGTGSAYVVSEVFRAMDAARLPAAEVTTTGIARSA